MGEPQQGIEGFRRTYREADGSLRLALLSGRSAGLAYQDAALGDLLTQDEELARWFTEYELGALAGDTAEARDMRQTLRTFFGTRMRVAPAAELLFLHRNTLIHRLERIEGLLGNPLGGRTAEVQAALALADTFAPPAA